jgi:cysteine-rich repeat protein
VTSPSGGPIEITKRAGSASEPGFYMFGLLFDITAPTQSPETPLVITFKIDGSLAPSGAGMTVFKDGDAVAGCTGAAGQAVPDPCVSTITRLVDGDLQITVLTSTASEWTLGQSAGPFRPLCGDGNLDVAEECDDGNLLDGDCCTSSCTHRVALTFGCMPALPAGASLALKKDPAGAKNALKWKWKSDDTFSVEDLGSPDLDTPLALCIYDGDGLVVGGSAPAGGSCGATPCWKMDPLKGKVGYADKSLTPSGIAKLQAKSGGAGKGLLAVQGKGDLLRLSRLSLKLPVRARLIRGDGSPACWEARFSAPDNVKKNDEGQFTGTSD